jgi:hypothetical protein
MQVQSAPLDINVVLWLGALRPRLAILFRDKLHLYAIHADHELGFVDGLALLLAAFIARCGRGAVDACSDGHPVDLEGLVAVDCDEEAVEAVCESDGDVGDDLEIGMGWREEHGDAVSGFLLVGGDGDRPGSRCVEGWVCA